MNFVGLLLSIGLVAAQASACKASCNMPSPKLADRAARIVRAIAVVRTEEVAGFRAVGTIRGPVVAALNVPGSLAEADEFNDDLARSDCQGAALLLILKMLDSGEMSPYWASTAPVKEPLRSAQDQGLLWVRTRARQW